jgi:lipid-A-disaccharide synthase
MPNLVCILPVVDHVSNYVRTHTHNWPSPLHLVTGDADKFASFDAAEVALAASGTVTTELALAGTPMVVAYRLGALTYALARPFVNVRFITLANILLDRPAVPEFIQSACTGAALADALLRLLTDEQAREKQKRDLAEAVTKLGLGGERPSVRAAQALLDFATTRSRAVCDAS